MLKTVSSGYAHQGTMVPGNEDWGIYLSAIDAGKLKPEAQTETDKSAVKPFELNPDSLGLLRQWFSPLYNYVPRDLPHHAIISESVFERMTKAKPLYAPQGLFDLADDLRKKRETVDAAVERLRETGSLSDEEKNDIVNFEAKLKLTRWPRDFSENDIRLRAAEALTNVVKSEDQDIAGQ